MDHIAGIGPQPIQLHGVLLAGHGGGDALTLQHQEDTESQPNRGFQTQAAWLPLAL